MNMARNKTILYALILAFTFLCPFVFPNFGTQLATLWLMIIVALTWDMTGGQMGYNSLGNIFFYGTGMYVAALIAIGMVYDVGDYTNAAGGGIYEFSDAQYFGGMFLGVLGAGLGVAIAAGELVSNWDWVGGGQGIALPVYPGDLDTGKIVFYFLFAAIGVSVFVFAKWLYGTRFGAAINAIRDDEEKADAMGIHTLRYKLYTWAMAAFFVGMAGGVSAFQLIHFEPLESAYQTINLGIFMVVCVLLGGQGSYLELPARLAMGCARRADCRYRGLLPGWRDGLVNA
jgi:branched-chain amino acid transport system permease protein